MLISKILQSAEVLINQMLERDPLQRAQIQPLVGRNVCLHINELSKEIFIAFTEQGVQLTFGGEQEVDITITGSAFALLQLAKGDRPFAASGTNVDIKGDVTVAQQMYHCFKALDIDWEDYLSQWTGDVVANRIGQGVRTVKQDLEESHKQLKQTVRDYLLHESNWLPAKEELEDFLTGVDDIRFSVERLEAQIQQLKGIFSK